MSQTLDRPAMYRDSDGFNDQVTTEGIPVAEVYGMFMSRINAVNNYVARLMVCDDLGERRRMYSVLNHELDFIDNSLAVALDYSTEPCHFPPDDVFDQLDECGRMMNSLGEFSAELILPEREEIVMVYRRYRVIFMRLAAILEGMDGLEERHTKFLQAVRDWAGGFFLSIMKSCNISADSLCGQFLAFHRKRLVREGRIDEARCDDRTLLEGGAITDEPEMFTQAFGSNVASAMSARNYRLRIYNGLLRDEGVYERDYGNERIERVLEPYCSRYADSADVPEDPDQERVPYLLYIDLDHFKVKNDTFGHPLGDCLLKGTLRAINNAARRWDFFVRQGGEEILGALVIPTTKNGAIIAADRLRRAIEENAKAEAEEVARELGYDLPSHPALRKLWDELVVTVSIGLCGFFDVYVPGMDGLQAKDQMIQSSDGLLYQIKELGGRNGVGYMGSDRASSYKANVRVSEEEGEGSGGKKKVTVVEDGTFLAVAVVKE